MATLLLSRHSGTEKPRFSLYQLFGGVEQIVRGRHEVVAMPIHGAWPKPDVEAWMLTHGFQADLFVTPHSHLVQILREHGWPGRVIYQAMGGPQWPGGLRQVLPYLTPTDRIWCSAVADLRLYEALVEQNGAQPPAVVLPYGADTAAFSPPDPAVRNELRAARGIDPDEFVLVYATPRLTVEKNLPALLEVLHALTSTGRKARLIVAGELENVPFYEFRIHPTGLGDKLRAMAANLGLSDRLELIPWSDAAGRCALFNMADAYVNLSLPHDEGFALAQAEAMSTGLPVVSAAWGGLMDMVVEGRNGFLADTWLSDHGVRVDMPKAVRALMLLADDPSQRLSMRESARAHAGEQYGWSRYTDRVLSLVDEVLAGTPAPARPHFSEFGERFHARFSRTVGDRTEAVTPVYTGFADADYRRLMEPYVSREAPSGTQAFAALPGTCRGDYYYSGDLLWPGRIRISPAEAGVMQRLDRWRPTPVGDLACSEAELLGLVAKGLVGLASAGA